MWLGFIGDDNRYEDLLDRSSQVAMTVGTFRVLDLEEIIRQKQESNRPKDRAILELLESVLEQQKQND